MSNLFWQPDCDIHSRCRKDPATDANSMVRRSPFKAVPPQRSYLRGNVRPDGLISEGVMVFSDRSFPFNRCNIRASAQYRWFRVAAIDWKCAQILVSCHFGEPVSSSYQ